MSLFSGEVVNLGDASSIGPYKLQTIAHLEVQLAAASTAQTIFIAPANYQVVSVREVHAVAGGSGATVTLEKLTGTTAPGSGTAMLTAAIVLTGAANTVQTTAATNIIQGASKMAAGDRMAFKLAGTLTGLAGCLLEVGIARV